MDKKHKEGMFDVTMGSVNGVEVCQPVGAFLLNKLSQIVNKADVGLYRDGGSQKTARDTRRTSYEKP